MYKFNRVYRLLIGKAGGKGVEIKPPLQIEFIQMIAAQIQSMPVPHLISFGNPHDPSQGKGIRAHTSKSSFSSGLGFLESLMCHAEIELGAVVENGMTVHSLLPCLADGDMTTTGRTLTISGGINPRKSHLNIWLCFG